MPSVVQKRPWANGRALEIANTTVLGWFAASWLNLRTEVAHTPVSILGKMFRIRYLPFPSFNV